MGSSHDYKPTVNSYGELTVPTNLIPPGAWRRHCVSMSAIGEGQSARMRYKTLTKHRRHRHAMPVPRGHHNIEVHVARDANLHGGRIAFFEFVDQRPGLATTHYA